jgi:hypothetical protein
MRREWVDREIRTAAEAILHHLGQRAPGQDLPVSPVTLQGDNVADPPVEPPPGSRRAARRQRKRARRK